MVNISSLAILISGAVTSGKSTLAKSISEKNRIPLFDEGSCSSYLGIIPAIDSKKHPKAIFEHCDIYRDFSTFRQEYARACLFVLELDQTLLMRNFHWRKNLGAEGDYSRIDPIQQQIDMMKSIQRMKLEDEDENHRIFVFGVSEIEDYERVLRQISTLVNF